MRWFLKTILIGIILAGVLGAVVFLIPAPASKKIMWGVNFSQMQAEALHLNWKQLYLSILEDLGVKKIKLVTNWDFVGGTRGTYFFDDIDWQIAQAQSYHATIVYVVGMKTGRWPECHIPSWAEGLSKQEQQKEILSYITAVVSRYKDSGVIEAWQAENEPLFRFGQCPWYDTNFLKQEVALIKSLDPNHPVIISDSGEQSLWWQAARIGDIVGTTMYRRIWVHLSKSVGFYATFPLPPSAYWIKSSLVSAFFGKKVINVELQAEPWTKDFFYDVPVNVQEKSMNPDQFEKVVQYAKRTGLDQFYFWGTEWWYWMKTVQHKPDIWNTAHNIIRNTQ